MAPRGAKRRCYRFKRRFLLLASLVACHFLVAAGSPRSDKLRVAPRPRYDLRDELRSQDSERDDRENHYDAVRPGRHHQEGHGVDHEDVEGAGGGEVYEG